MGSGEGDAIRLTPEQIARVMGYDKVGTNDRPLDTIDMYTEPDTMGSDSNFSCCGDNCCQNKALEIDS